MVFCVAVALNLLTVVVLLQIGWKDQTATKLKPELTVDEAVDFVQDIFTTAGERDIYTGDAVLIAVITKEGTKEIRFELKKD